MPFSRGPPEYNQSPRLTLDFFPPRFSFFFFSLSSSGLLASAPDGLPPVRDRWSNEIERIRPVERTCMVRHESKEPRIDSNFYLIIFSSGGGLLCVNVMNHLAYTGRSHHQELKEAVLYNTDVTASLSRSLTSPTPQPLDGLLPRSSSSSPAVGLLL